VGASFAKTGDQVSMVAGVSRASVRGESDISLGGAVGVDMVRSGSTTVSAQGGIAWRSSDGVTGLRFPIGVALKGSIATSSAAITPWIMPRLNVVRYSASGESASQTDLGASGGLTFTFPGGFGIHTALDMLLLDNVDNPLTFGLGLHYLLGRSTK